MKQATGSIVKRKCGGKTVYHARVTFTDPVTRKRREFTKRAQSRAHAAALAHELAERVAAGETSKKERRTFADLADFYVQRYATKPVFHGDTKVEGIASWKGVRQIVKMLSQHFGFRSLDSITFDHVRELKRERLSTPTRHGKQRSIARVNRELSVLRRMFTIAVREQWIARNPILGSETLISSKSERPRDRVLTAEEEVRLLAACDAPKRRHLRPILVCALDTGMRHGEIIKLRWSDIDLDREVISVQARNTKTARGRQVPITPRLRAELLALSQKPRPDDGRVFAIDTSCKRAFASAKRDAGIGDFKFHDCRHTAATRLSRGGLGPFEVGRILGHSQAQTTYRYVNATNDTVQLAKNILSAS